MSTLNKISVSTISLNIVLRNDVPKYVIDFFEKGIYHVEIPTVLISYRFTFDNSCNIVGKTQMLFQQDKSGKYHLSIYHQFDFNNPDEAQKGYWFVGGLAQYAEDNKMAGYIKHENLYEKVGTQLFGFKDKLPFWLSDLFIDFDENKTYNQEKFNELCQLGHKIKFSDVTEAEINQMIATFDKNVPYPNGSNLFFYPENYNARTFDISQYNPTVEEVVRKCLEYKAIEL
jgi:hypothetical protein